MTSFRWREGLFFPDEATAGGGGKTRVLKSRVPRWGWPVRVAELGTGSEIETCCHSWKSGEAAALFPWQGCNASDTPGREGPARSVTARHVQGVSRAVPPWPRLQLVPALRLGLRLQASIYWYVTAGSMFLKVTRSYCTRTISRTPPLPLLFAVL